MAARPPDSARLHLPGSLPALTPSGRGGLTGAWASYLRAGSGRRSRVPPGPRFSSHPASQRRSVRLRNGPRGRSHRRGRPRTGPPWRVARYPSRRPGPARRGGRSPSGRVPGRRPAAASAARSPSRTARSTWASNGAARSSRWPGAVRLRRALPSPITSRAARASGCRELVTELGAARRRLALADRLQDPRPGVAGLVQKQRAQPERQRQVRFAAGLQCRGEGGQVQRGWRGPSLRSRGRARRR